jgi:hypothetical protein
MTLVIEIGLGIVFGVFLLGLIHEIPKRLEDWSNRRYRQREFRRRVKIADENGFIYNSESFTPFEDQLLQWEGEQAEKRREKEMDEWLIKNYPHRWRLKQSLGPDAWRRLLRDEQRLLRDEEAARRNQ